MILPVALTGAGAAALINAWLAMRCGRVRVQEKLYIGDGGNPRLTARMRAHANFVEYTPIVLILIALIEFAVGTSTILWATMATYIVARLLHPIGMDGVLPARMAGAVGTILVTVGLALYALTIPFTASGRVGPADGATTFEAIPADG